MANYMQNLTKLTTIVPMTPQCKSGRTLLACGLMAFVGMTAGEATLGTNSAQAAQTSQAAQAVQIAQATGGKKALRLPRFAALRATRVNLRKGPGVRFPIQWVYLQRDLPVEIIQVFDNWRRVRDWQGTEGWVYHSMLTGRRSIRVTQNLAIIRKTPDPRSAPLAKLEAGVVGRLQKCPAGSTVCQVSLGGITGWLPRTAFWGVYQNEVVK